MLGRDRPIALFAPSFRSIKLYRDGRIEYRGKSGSVIGARARVDASGTRRAFRDDTREVVLTIDGPGVSISESLPVNGIQAHEHARQFAAIVNDTAARLAGSTPAPTAPSPTPPSPPWPSPPQPIGRAGVLEQLERLGRLRESGVLTEDEFQAQKAVLLRPTPEP